MPLPIPQTRESENEFMTRCMSDGWVKGEFDDIKQRLGVCYSAFERKDESFDSRLKEVFDGK